MTDERDDFTLCDRCGRSVPAGRRYRLVLTLQQAAETLEVKPQDLARDLVKDMEKTIAEMARLDPQAIEDDVAVQYRADLCKECRDQLNARFAAKR